MRRESPVVLFLTILLVTGCGVDRRHGDGDPAVQELEALNQLAGSLEAKALAGDQTLVALSRALEERLTPADVGVLVRNYRGMLEGISSNTAWQPDAEFYATLERLSDLPVLSELPSRVDAKRIDGVERGGLRLATRSSALVLGQLQPKCGISCDAQALSYGYVDLALDHVEKFFISILASGVDCAKSGGELAKCEVDEKCTATDLAFKLGDCAVFAGGLIIDLSGYAEIKLGYAVAKLAIALWTAGSIGKSAALWANDCRNFQKQKCTEKTCPSGERLCYATNGAAATCCPTGLGCMTCAVCKDLCGETCCALGQRCDGGTCTTCATPCGTRCCTANELCDPAFGGSCVPCDNPCGSLCCPAGSQCIPSTLQCCAAPCGTSCCAAGQTCNPTTLKCESPTGVCDGFPPLNCAALCQQGAEMAAQQCAEKNGTLDPINMPACLADCQCILDAIPNFAACLVGPQCPDCADAEAVVKACERYKTVCKYPR